MALSLVRYGRIPEVARFETGAIAGLNRGVQVVIETHRGLQLGTFLERIKPASSANRHSPETEPEFPPPILRSATDEDLRDAAELKAQADAAFERWAACISDWGLDLELIDLEWTLDRRKLILYVLNERGPECTKLALQAAAAGLGLIEVQPVTAEGPVTQPSGGGGCGTCGCG